jgi:hypothetical protein
MVSSCLEVELALSKPELDLVRMKRVRRIVTSRIAAFAWAHEKIARKNDKVHDSFAGFCRIGVRNNELNEVVQDLDRDRLDALRRGIRL